MVGDVNAAKQISELMLDISGRLDESVAMVEKSCPTEEFNQYRRAVGKVLGGVLLEVLNPLYEKHPALRPEGF